MKTKRKLRNDITKAQHRAFKVQDRINRQQYKYDRPKLRKLAHFVSNFNVSPELRAVLNDQASYDEIMDYYNALEMQKLYQEINDRIMEPEKIIMPDISNFSLPSKKNEMKEVPGLPTLEDEFFKSLNDEKQPEES